MAENAQGDISRAQYNSRRAQLATLVHSTLRAIFSLFPANIPDFIYTKIVKPVPALKHVVNRMLRAILPPQMTIPEGVLLLNPNDPVLSGALSLGAFEKHFTEIFRANINAGMPRAIKILGFVATVMMIRKVS